LGRATAYLHRHPQESVGLLMGLAVLVDSCKIGFIKKQWLGNFASSFASFVA